MLSGGLSSQLPRRTSGHTLAMHPAIASLWSQPVIFTSQGVQSAIRHPPKALQCCNPPQSEIRHA
eukprot:11997806-Alexandrium_andersonii.AAC.1